MRIQLLILLAAMAVDLHARSVSYYRCTAEDGEVVLSDRPCGEDAENLEVKIRALDPQVEEQAPVFQGGSAAPAAAPATPQPAATPGATPPTATAQPPAAAPEATPAVVEPPPYYASITLISPKNGEVIRSDDGRIPIAISTTPRLRKGDVIQVTLDGKAIARVTSNRATISGVTKGRRALGATVLDSTGKSLIEAQVIRFIRF